MPCKLSIESCDFLEFSKKIAHNKKEHPQQVPFFIARQDGVRQCIVSLDIVALCFVNKKGIQQITDISSNGFIADRDTIADVLSVGLDIDHV